LTGPLRFLGEYWGGQIGWQLGFLCITNFLTAAMICFSVLAVFLLEPKGLIGSITRKQGIFLAINGHLGSTLASLIFLNFVYRPTVDLKVCKLSLINPFKFFNILGKIVGPISGGNWANPFGRQFNNLFWL
jgi:hypothetical protein